MWNGDSVQLAIDTGSPQAPGGGVNTYYELGFAMTSAREVATHAWDGNFSWSTAKIRGEVTKEGYDLAIEIPWRSLGQAGPPASFGLNVVINHKGADGVRRFVEWTPGTARVKNREVFARAIPADGRAASVQNLITERARYTLTDVIQGRLAEYSREGTKGGKVRFAVFSPDKEEVWKSDWIDAPPIARDSTRTINFAVPAEFLGAEGEREVRVEQEGGGPGAAAVFRVEDIEGRIAEELSRITARAGEAEKRWVAMPNRRDDAYLRLGFSVIRHYRGRLEGSEEAPAAEWRRLQLAELSRVLDAVEKRLSENGDEAIPAAERGPVTVKDGVFWARRGDALVPNYFYGYGHFGTVAKDIPLLAEMGASLIQQEEGPKARGEDGRLADSVDALERVFRNAANNGVKVDFLLAPHYFPEEAFEKFSNLRVEKPAGVIKYNIDHPAARKILEDWVAAIVPRVAASPALLSVCLSNEPTYAESGRDAYSRKDWARYLEEKHGKIAALNALYGMSYAAFDQVPAPEIGAKKTVGEKRAYFDWIRFNQQHFAAWHRWLNERVKAAAPQVLTHAKIMTDIFDREMLPRGIDPELICNITDLAGNDSYAWPKRYENYAYDWRQEEMWYDLLHSFRGQPVFNSENHLVLDGSPPVSIAPEHSRCVLWQSALHHLAASVTWVWEKPAVPDLEGSIYLRPANVFAMGEAMLDLTRLSKEVARVAGAKAEVALLYSVPSFYWDENYPKILASAYAALTFTGHPVTFISETQLAEGKRSPVNDDVRVIISAGSRHVPEAVIPALAEFVKKGGTFLSIGEGNLQYDEYDRPRTLTGELVGGAHLPWKKDGDEELARALQKAVAGAVSASPVLSDQAGKPVWGVEYRVVPEEGGFLVAITNFMNEQKTLSLPLEGSATDLVSNVPIDLKEIAIEPMQYRLLRVKADSVAQSAEGRMVGMGADGLP